MASGAKINKIRHSLMAQSGICEMVQFKPFGRGAIVAFVGMPLAEKRPFSLPLLRLNILVVVDVRQFYRLVVV